MFEIVLIIHVILAIVLVLSILIQHGKGADAGIAFGSSTASNSAFGSSGANSFLYKATFWLAVGFFTTSLFLSYLASSKSKESSIEQTSVVKQEQNKKDKKNNIPLN